MSLDVTIVFAVNDPDGGEIDIVVDYGDNTSESATVPNGEVTATHGYNFRGTWNVLVTATDDKGLSTADLAMVTTYITTGVLLVEAELESLTSCDTFSSNNEFFGTVSALGQSKNCSVTIPTGGTAPLSFGPSQTFVVGPGAIPVFSVSITVTEDDAGLEGADDPVGSYTGPNQNVLGVSRAVPLRQETLMTTMGSGDCRVEFRYTYKVEVIP